MSFLKMVIGMLGGLVGTVGLLWFIFGVANPIVGLPAPWFMYAGIVMFPIGWAIAGYVMYTTR